MTAAPNGQWRKRYKGRDYYFGAWADPLAALESWRRDWPAITSGGSHRARETIVRPSSRVVTVLAMFTAFLKNAEARVHAGELAMPTTRKYLTTLRTATKVFGAGTPVNALKPSHFTELYRTAADQSVYTRERIVMCTRAVFKWAHKSGYIDQVNFGPDFNMPSAKSKRAYRRQHAKTPYTAAQVRKLLAACRPSMLPKFVDAHVLRAAIYLGINGGYGPSDLCELHADLVDPGSGILKYPRRKTETDRVVPLWPETQRALMRISMSSKGALFTSSRGQPLVHGSTNRLAKWFTILLDAAELKETGRRFYDLRRTHATVAAQVPDKDARKLIMGHVLTEVLDDYVLHFPPARLESVTDHIRNWFHEGRANSSP